MNEKPFSAMPQAQTPQADLVQLESDLAAAAARAALAEAAYAKAEAQAALAQVMAAYQQAAQTHLHLPYSPPYATSPASYQYAQYAPRELAPHPSNPSAAHPPVMATAVLPPAPIPVAAVPAAVFTTPVLPPAAIPAIPVQVPFTPPFPTQPLAPDNRASSGIAPTADSSPAVPWFLDNRVMQSTSAVLVSAVFHLLVLIVLGLWLLPTLLRESPGELLASQDLTSPELVTQMLDTKFTAEAESTFTSNLPANLSGGSGTGIAGVADPSFKQFDSKSNQVVSVKIGDINHYSGQGRILTKDVPKGAKGDPLVVVQDYQEAMDRITQEILLRLAKSKVLVVWCFDQSESMQDDRDEIRQRIARVYTELGLSGATRDDALLTSIVSYGQAMNIHTRNATANIDLIRNAMDQVPNDPSGLERQCLAVGHAIAEHRAHVNVGHRQMMLILVTDESGQSDENVTVLESTIAEAKAAGCAIYVLGREAVFGYPFAHMNAVVTVPAIGGGTVSRSFVVPIDRGPETPFVEQLQTEGFHARKDAHPSGFGPYEQVRMARETGGMFFMLPSPEIDLFERDDRKYALEQMRPYMPDLSSRLDYANERDKHPDRATLWKVINDLNPYDSERAKYITPRMTFSPDPGNFVTQVRFEQERARQYVIYLDAAEKALDGMKAQRQREPSPRWQANYDLIFAQLLAYKVRIYEYGAYLENFINNPKPTEPLTPTHQLAAWHIAHRQETITGYLTESYIKRSRAAFEAIIRDHAGTPWAARAEFELKRGFGVELNASYYNPNPPPSFGPPAIPQQPILPPKL